MSSSFFHLNDPPSSFISFISLNHVFFFFFNDPAPTEISPLSLHDALPIWPGHREPGRDLPGPAQRLRIGLHLTVDRVRQRALLVGHGRAPAAGPGRAPAAGARP